MLTDGALYIHGTGATAFGPISLAAGIFGDVLCQAGTQYSNLELDFGAPGSAATYPYVSQFPGYTEQGYTNPPVQVGVGGVPWGLHIQIMSAFNTLQSVNFIVCTSATTAATSTGAVASRSLTLAQMAVVGACYFIPCNPSQVLEFLRFQAVLTGSNATLGTILAWFGPLSGGVL